MKAANEWVEETFGDDSDLGPAESCCQNTVAMTARGAFLYMLNPKGNGEFLPVEA